MEHFFASLPVWICFALFCAGVAAIDRGSSLLVRSSVAISEHTGIPRIVIGATVTSVATSFPEVSVSTTAAIGGYADMAVGNILGSCLCNIGLILALCILIRPLSIRRRLFVERGAVMIGGGLIVVAFALAGGIPRLGGLLLTVLFAAYVARTVQLAKQHMLEANGKDIDADSYHEALWQAGIQFAGGMVLLGSSSVILVHTGRRIAAWLGVPELIIALTMVALGTSLPELVTAVRAATVGEGQLSVGNVVGANIIDLLIGLGVPSLIQPLAVSKQTRLLDAPAMLLLMVMLFVMAMIKGRLKRIHGTMILLVYTAYLVIMMRTFA